MALRDVELVEDEPERPDGPDEGGPARPWLRRHPRAVGALAVGLVLAVAVAGGLEVRARQQDAARVEALQGVPGVLRPLDPALPVDVSVSRSYEDATALPVAVHALLAGVAAGDVVVAGMWDPDGVDVVGVGAEDGRERWRTPIAPPPDLPAPESRWVWCTAYGRLPWQPAPAVPAGRGPVACTAEWLPPSAPAADGSMTAQSRTSLLEVDPVDGRVLHRVELPPGRSVARAPDGWVTATAEDGTVVVESLAGDGTSRWRTVLDVPGGDPVLGAGEFFGVLVDEERVLVQAEGGAWVLAAQDGAAVGTVADAGAGMARLLPGGRLLLEDATPSGAPRGVLHLPDGTSHDLDGEELVQPALDDGSLGDVLLTTDRGDGLGVEGRVTLRGPDGEALWSAQGRPADGALVVDGTVVVLDGTHLRRLDGQDGDERWSAPLPRRVGAGQLLTDGRVLLLGTNTGVDAWTYDGAHAWSAALQRDGDEVRLRAGEAVPSPTGPSGDVADMVTWTATARGRLVLMVSSTTSSREDVLVLR
ncbi:PQQ-binding-like beta-propeller repeat protein [Cellulomonas sp.]|uniref:outer membrane protein assembly factor BamB family protein n=1 Tax=Cellulomonas sp. TaxID=40001 RepID=UPI002811D093|nr:PQQ-binding-like beta-propeller repeat protein [Cellulomonas sp.]